MPAILANGRESNASLPHSGHVTGNRIVGSSTACDPSTLQKTKPLGEQKILADITELGWHCMNVLEDDGHPPWSFSIGFHDTWQYPELIIIGRSRATAHQMLSTIADELDANRRPDLIDPTPYETG